MGCSCQKGSAASAAAKASSYVVTASDGSKKAYRTEIEAKAAAKRTGGTVKTL